MTKVASKKSMRKTASKQRTGKKTAFSIHCWGKMVFVQVWVAHTARMGILGEMYGCKMGTSMVYKHQLFKVYAINIHKLPCQVHLIYY